MASTCNSNDYNLWCSDSEPANERNYSKHFEMQIQYFEANSNEKYWTK